MTLAQGLGTAYDLALAHLGGSLTYSALRDPDALLEHVEPLLQIAAANQFATYAAMGGVFRGWAMAQQGRSKEGIAFLRRSLGEYLASGSRTGHANYLGLLADAYLQAGAVAEGLAVIEDALAVQSEEQFYLPDLYRRRGDLLARQGAGVPRVEASYRDAIALAQRIGAKLFELRATTSLVRLLLSDGRAAEARDSLAPLYARFTEGFDTRDLVEARALLDELN